MYKLLHWVSTNLFILFIYNLQIISYRYKLLMKLFYMLCPSCKVVSIILINRIDIAPKKINYNHVQHSRNINFITL